MTPSASPIASSSNPVAIASGSNPAPNPLTTTAERVDQRGNVAKKCAPCRASKKFCDFPAPEDTCVRCSTRSLPCGPKEMTIRRPGVPRPRGANRSLAPARAAQQPAIPPTPRAALLAPLAALNLELQTRKNELGAHAAQLGARLVERTIDISEAQAQLGVISAELSSVDSQLQSIAAFRVGPVFAPQQAPAPGAL